METVVARNLKGYELRERIGTGGFGAVYRAYQPTVGREVAIKVILPAFANTPEFVRRFEAEAQLVARLEHPHITPLYDYWRDLDGAYLVMRWLRGGSLRDALQNGSIELRAAALLLDQIAGALSLAHRNQVIHRDIKPGNILLDEDGNAYLTDFGIAKDLKLNADFTKPDAIIGSLDYISPEQARGEAVTSRTDIYSLGVTLYEVVTGEHPFHKLSSVERLYKHINEPLPEILTLESGVASDVNAVIQKATAKNPANRYEDALTFAVDFRRAAKLDRTPESVIETLTKREHEILHLLVRGMSNKEIAEELTVTVSTIKWYINQIYSKLGVRSRVQAMVRARELDLLVPDGTAAIEPSEVVAASDLHPENPYKGLRPFSSADSQDFFGRERITSKLLSLLGETGEYRRFLAVVGPSGGGKSSLVKASVIPALWRGEVPGSEKWFIVEMLPGARPLDELEIALTRVAANQAGNLHEQLRRDGHGLARIASLILPNDGSDLLLVVDQFEEVFTLCEDEQARRHFLELLYNAVTAPHSRVRVLITLRADFYDRPLHDPKFGEMVRNRLETIMPLSADELEQAVSKPAERVGVAFEPGLVSTIVADVNYQPGALPLLQYALTELFDQREGRSLTLAAYQRIGGTAGALAKRAEEIYLSLDEPSRNAARQLFLRLVTLGEGTEDTRRRVRRSELTAISANADLMEDLIDTYSRFRLLTLDHDPGTRAPTVELAHEAILREWERMGVWLSESREDIRRERAIARAVEDWQAHNQDTSYLLTGMRLEEAQSWRDHTGLAITPGLHAYIAASVTEDQRNDALEQERLVREAAQERRAVNRLRYLVVVLAIFLVTAFILSVIAVSEQNIARLARDNEALARAEAEESLRYTEAQRLGLESFLLAQAGAESNIVGLLAVRSLMTDYTPQGDAALQKALMMEFPARVLRSSSISGNDSVTISPDGTLLAVGKQDESVEVWDLSSDTMIAEFSGGNTVQFLPDGERIVISPLSETDLALTVFNLTSGKAKEVTLAGLNGAPWGTVPLDDGRTLVVSSRAGDLILLDTTTWEELVAVRAHDDAVGNLSLSSDGEYLLSAGHDFSVKMWRANTLELVETFRNTRIGDWYNAVALSPDGRLVVAGNAGGDVIVWDVAEPTAPIHFWEAHHNVLRQLQFTPDGRYVITGADTVRVWDPLTGENLHPPLTLPGRVTDLSLLPDSRTLAVTFLGADTWLLDLKTEGNIATFLSDMMLFNHLAFSPDGKWLARAVLNTLYIDDLEHGETRELEQGTFLGPVRFARDGKSFIYSAIGIGLLRLDLRSQEVVETYARGEGYASDLAISPDENYLAYVDGAAKLLVLDMRTGDPVFEKQYIWNLNSVEFSPDGRYLLGVPQTGEVTLIDTSTWGIVWALPLTEWGWPDVAFSHDGKYFAVGGGGPTISLWETETQAHVREFVGHYEGVMTVAFTPDDRHLLSGGADGTARLWEVETGKEVRRFGPGVLVSHVTVSPDGRYGLVSDAATAYMWPLDLEESIEMLCRLLTRDLTDRERVIYGIETEDATCPQFES